MVFEDGYNEGESEAVSKDDELIKETFFSSYNEDLKSMENKSNKRYVAFLHNHKHITNITHLEKVMSYNT